MLQNKIILLKDSQMMKIKTKPKNKLVKMLLAVLNWPRAVP